MIFNDMIINDKQIRIFNGIKRYSTAINDIQ